MFAEYRDLKHVSKSLLRSLKTRKWEDIKKEIPKEFTLGKGHVKFFWDKLSFITKRSEACYHELIKRGYNIPPYNSAEYNVAGPIWLYLETRDIDYVPSSNDIAKSVARITEKIMMKPEWYKYYGDAYPLGILGVDN